MVLARAPNRHQSGLNPIERLDIKYAKQRQPTYNTDCRWVLHGYLPQKRVKSDREQLSRSFRWYRIHGINPLPLYYTIKNGDIQNRPRAPPPPNPPPPNPPKSPEDPKDPREPKGEPPNQMSPGPDVLWPLPPPKEPG